MAGEREVSRSVVSRKTASLAAITLSAGNAGRDGFIIHNDSAAVLFVKYGVGASPTDFTHRLTGQSSLEHRVGKVYRGPVTGAWDANVGAAQVTEFLP